MSDFFKNEEEWEDYELLKKMAREESTHSEEDVEEVLVEKVLVEENKEHKENKENPESSIIDHIDEISSLYGDATFLHFVLDMNDGAKNYRYIKECAEENAKTDGPILIRHENYDREKAVSKHVALLRGLKLYFRYEFDRYEEYKNTNVLNESDKIEWIWREVFDDGFKIPFHKYKFYIRAWIKYALREILSRMNENFEELYSNASEESRWLLNYARNHSDDPDNWTYRIMHLREVLSFCRERRPGTIGHLLWILLYVSEINEGVFGNQIDFVNADSSRLEGMFSYQLELFVSNSVESTSNNTNVTMNMMAITRAPRSGSHSRHVTGLYHNISRIIHKDLTLRKNFLWKNGKKAGHRCFAILTDMQKDHYVTVSCYDTDLYDEFMKIFKSCQKNSIYKCIPATDLDKSLYGWKYQNKKYKELSQMDTEINRRNKHLTKPQYYKKMFSCAERRLIDTYEKVKTTGNYIIISQKKPCYKCERVLNHHGVNGMYFEDYFMTNETDEKNKLDSFADLVY